MEYERFRPSHEQEPMDQSDGTAGTGPIRREHFRSGGKGGQNVNKVETGVRVRVAIEDAELLAKLRQRFPGYVTKEGELIVEATKERTQESNERRALARLEEILKEVRREPKERIPTKPKRAAKEKRLETKRQRGETKRLRKKPREW